MRLGNKPHGRQFNATEVTIRLSHTHQFPPPFLADLRGAPPTTVGSLRNDAACGSVVIGATGRGGRPYALDEVAELTNNVTVARKALAIVLLLAVQGAALGAPLAHAHPDDHETDHHRGRAVHVHWAGTRTHITPLACRCWMTTTTIELSL